MNSGDAVAGRLTLRPGRHPAVQCERPAIGTALLGQLAQGRRAAWLPELLGSLFTLCGPVHRQTARRAVLAACGHVDAPAERQRDALSIAMHTAREHLQRLAIDWPRLEEGQAPAAGASRPAADAIAWMRDAPVMAVASAPARDASWPHAAAALPGWLERRLFGMPPASWLARWGEGAGRWLEHWSTRHEHPVTGVLRAVRSRAQVQRWQAAPLDVAERGPDDWRALAAALSADIGFAAQPRWHGAPAETGPWTRRGRQQPVESAWDRLGARLADLAQIADGATLDCGALRLAPGEAIAWSEMSRGLLVHRVQLEPDVADPALARVLQVQVLAPTEWNFHADGAFARWLAGPGSACDAPDVRLAAMALDPCLAFTIEQAEMHDA